MTGVSADDALDPSGSLSSGEERREAGARGKTEEERASQRARRAARPAAGEERLRASTHLGQLVRDAKQDDRLEALVDERREELERAGEDVGPSVSELQGRRRTAPTEHAGGRKTQQDAPPRAG